MSQLETKVIIRIRLDRQADVNAVARDMARLSRETGVSVQAYADMRSETRMAGLSTRRLALDLRMLSIGLSMVRRNIGDTNPQIDAMISGIQIASGAISSIVGGASLLSRGLTFLRSRSQETGTAVAAAGGAAASTSLSMVALASAIAIAAAAGITAYQMSFDLFSGIGRLRREVRRLTRDLEGLKTEMAALRAEQAGVGAEQAKWRFLIQETEAAMDAQLMTTAEGERMLELYEAQSAKAALAASELAWRIADEGAMTARTTAQIERYNYQISQAERAPARALGEWWRQPAPGGPPPVAVPRVPMPTEGLQLGGEIRRPGFFYAHRGEVFMQREQMLTMVRGEGGPVVVPVSVSLAGATISGVTDLMGTFRRAGDEVGVRVRRQLQFMRRPRLRSRM